LASDLFQLEKLKVRVDYGEETGTLPDSKTKDHPTEKRQKFTSMVEAMNYLSSEGLAVCFRLTPNLTARGVLYTGFSERKSSSLDPEMDPEVHDNQTNRHNDRKNTSKKHRRR
jgi:hypothetical protein